MGHKKKISKTLYAQAYQKLNSMQSFGQAKHLDKFNQETRAKIYSFSTYKTYWKHIRYFIKWVNKNYPDVKNLNDAKPLVKKWLCERSVMPLANGEQLSAWTLHLEASALNKLFQITEDDEDRFIPPARRRRNIKRSRFDVTRDKHFSTSNNIELINFAKATGLRRAGLSSIKGSDLYTREQIENEITSLDIISDSNLSDAQRAWLKICNDALIFNENYFIKVAEKGGRTRLAPIVGEHTSAVIERFSRTGFNEKVWQHVPSAMDVHAYRSQYATAVYKEYARPFDEIPYDAINNGIGKKYKSQVYYCRNDERGKWLDRVAMKKASIALGHNRINIVAENYIRSI